MACIGEPLIGDLEAETLAHFKATALSLPAGQSGPGRWDAGTCVVARTPSSSPARWPGEGLPACAPVLRPASHCGIEKRSSGEEGALSSMRSVWQRPGQASRSQRAAGASGRAAPYSSPDLPPAATPHESGPRSAAPGPRRAPPGGGEIAPVTSRSQERRWSDCPFALEYLDRDGTALRVADRPDTTWTLPFLPSRLCPNCAREQVCPSK